MTASALAVDFPQPSPYHDGVVITDYAAYEAVEGVPVYWDGDGRLLGEAETEYMPPAWFITGFPDTPLEGILTSKTPDVEQIRRIARSAEVEAGWRKLYFLAVDLPELNEPALTRQRELKRLIEAAKLPQLRTVRWQRFSDKDAFSLALNELYSSGGKGFVMRHVESSYKVSADELLLVLPYDIGEAVVVDHRPGKGNFAGMLGGVEVTTAIFGKFRIGSGFSDAERRNPPPIGARIGFRYRGLTDTGKPKSPVYLSVLPPLEKKIGGWLRTTHLMWLFIALMGGLALLDALSHRRGGACWDFKSSIISTGLLGTFIGIWWGLYNFDTDDIAAGVPTLLEGLKLSFVTSIVGIFLSTILSVVQTLAGVNNK